MIDFAEELPAQCPPQDANDVKFERIFRTIPDEEIEQKHFLSKMANGDKLQYGTDPCRFASCSMYTAKRAARKMLQFPKFTGGTVAELTIPEGSGESKKKKQHVDFWAYQDFNFLEAVTKIHTDEDGDDE